MKAALIRRISLRGPQALFGWSSFTPMTVQSKGSYIRSAKPSLGTSNTQLRSQKTSRLNLMPKFLLYPCFYLLVFDMSLPSSKACPFKYRLFSSAAIDEESTCPKSLGVANLTTVGNHWYR